MYIINKETCIGCGVCEPVCPVETISQMNDGKYDIGELCVDCGMCETVCPVAAISQE